MVYIPNTQEDRQEMLKSMGLSKIDELFADIPEGMRNFKIDMPAEGMSEMEVRKHMQTLAGNNADMNKYLCFLGAGAYRHYVPAVVDEILKKSEFYTAYTPYQAEISQGVLQSIYEYQTHVARLTGMEVSNASMYDGGTSLYEAALMTLKIGKKRNKVIVDSSVHPEYRNVASSYFRTIDKYQMVTVAHKDGKTNTGEILQNLDKDTAGVIVQTPNFFGTVDDFTALAKSVHDIGACLVIVVNPISLGVLKSPAEMGADIVIAEGQPMGMSLNYGGPYLGMFAARKEYARHMPGRIIGTTVDNKGNRGFVMTLQTREQHIRREKATSNICSNQALCALAASVYMCSLGKQGLHDLSMLNLEKAAYAKAEIKAKTSFNVRWKLDTFNEFVIEGSRPAKDILADLMKQNIIGGLDLGRYYVGLENCILVAVTEMNSRDEIDRFVKALAAVK